MQRLVNFTFSRSCIFYLLQLQGKLASGRDAYDIEKKNVSSTSKMQPKTTIEKNLSNFCTRKEENDTIAIVL